MGPSSRLGSTVGSNTSAGFAWMRLSECPVPVTLLGTDMHRPSVSFALLALAETTVSVRRGGTRSASIEGAVCGAATDATCPACRSADRLGSHCHTKSSLLAVPFQQNQHERWNSSLGSATHSQRIGDRASAANRWIQMEFANVLPQTHAAVFFCTCPSLSSSAY